MLIDINNTIKDAIFSADCELRELSLFIHENPEIANKEFKAAEALTNYMESKGFTVERGVAGLETAFAATYKRGSGGPVVSYNSEYDALPVIHHACGHNLIAITGVAAALGTKAVLDKYNLNGGVILFGTPAEEAEGGKIDIINAGLYQRADVSLMLHAASGGDGSLLGTLAAQGVQVSYEGKPAHAAGDPWDGLNALDAQTLAYTGIAMLRQHIMPDERIHGIVTKGGDAPNVVPDHTESNWLVRSDVADNLYKLRERVFNCFEAGALATGTKLSLRTENAYLDLRQNSVMAIRFEDVLTEMFGTVTVPRDIQLQVRGGSTDQGNVTYELPAIHGFFNITDPAKEPVPGHTVEFREAAKTEYAHLKALEASVAMSVAGTQIIFDPAYLAAIRKEYEDTVKSGKSAAAAAAASTGSAKPSQLPPKIQGFVRSLCHHSRHHW
ncbi:hypothetical protein GQ42DRAFT_145721 [Ramicandelaber brevisporus]|nr:hypothetical protein GQ42DRAFT_145721 [Ramicandelaber brevisporus]